MNKTFFASILLISALICVSKAQAWMMFPFFDINITEHTIGGDSTFSFHISESYPPDPVSYPVEDFSISTIGGIGLHTTNTQSSTSSMFRLTQDQASGWQNPTISCTSSNPLVTTLPTDHGVLINAQSYSSIECDVTNMKASSKTPVLIVPGVLGTDIFDKGEKLWLNLAQNIIDFGDQFMDRLNFSNNLSPSVIDLILGDVISKVGASYFSFDYTDGLNKEFVSQGYTQGSAPADSLFLFPYDWRYGVSEDTVNKLKQKILEIRAQTGSDKVDIVAHSTGGLLVKKYAIENPIDNHIRKAVFVGVPNTGAPKAIKVLLQGDNFGNPFLADSEMKKLAANFPVVYDLTPSEQYYNTKGSYVKIVDQTLLTSSGRDLDYNQANNFLTIDHSLNLQALANSKNLHTAYFDNFDLRTTGVDLYAIDGCKTGTLGNIVERRYTKNSGEVFVSYGQPQIVPGDGTVPLESATNLPIDSTHKYYALRADHGKMPSQSGIRQQIVNLLSGSNLSISNWEVTQDIALCKLNGRAISIYSPLVIDVTDQNGKHSGFGNDGGIYNDIPNADFEIMGDHKFVYLPTDGGQIYSIKVVGIGDGTFTLKNQNIADNQVATTDVFSNIPVTTKSTGVVNLGSSTTLSLDTNGDGIIKTISPSATISGSQSKDMVPPITTPNITGSMGQTGFYRSAVSIGLTAVDPIIDNTPNQTSGVLMTNYNLDGVGYSTYLGVPIIVTAEGSHTIKFFSTDNAGNNEDEKSVNFTIDGIPPEARISFSTSTQKLLIEGLDDTATTVSTTATSTRITDQGGNILQLTYSKKSQEKNEIQFGIRELRYNGVSAGTIPKTVLQYEWSTDKSGKFKELEQAATIGSLKIEAHYNAKKNVTEIQRSSGEGQDDHREDIKEKSDVKEILPGMVIIKILTAKGNATVSY